MANVPYVLDQASHQSGIAKTYDALEMTQTNIKFLRSTAETYRASQSGEHALGGIAAADRLIATLDAVSRNLDAQGAALNKNHSVIVTSQQDIAGSYGPIAV